MTSSSVKGPYDTAVFNVHGNRNRESTEVKLIQRSDQEESCIDKSLWVQEIVQAL